MVLQSFHESNLPSLCFSFYRHVLYTKHTSLPVGLEVCDASSMPHCPAFCVTFVSYSGSMVHPTKIADSPVVNLIPLPVIIRASAVEPRDRTIMQIRADHSEIHDSWMVLHRLVGHTLLEPRLCSPHE